MNRNTSSKEPIVASATHPLRENSLSTRLKLLLLAETKDRGRYADLEVSSGISAATWRTWWNRGGAPNGSLVEATAKRWPQFAYWLVTGHTDIRCGHDMPALAPEARGYISNWPEEGSTRNRAIKNGYSQEYLKLSNQLDGTETASDVESVMKHEALRIASIRRKEEIARNFEVQMSFEELLQLASQAKRHDHGNQ